MKFRLTILFTLLSITGFCQSIKTDAVRLFLDITDSSHRILKYYNPRTGNQVVDGINLPFGKIAFDTSKIKIALSGDTLTFNPINNITAINVKDYGAKGDGSANDYIAITSAITAAYVRGGGTVYFPKGVYNTSAKLSLASNVYLLGEGSEIHYTGSGSAVIEAAGVSNFGIESLKVTGNALTSSNPYGVSITNASHHGYVKDVTVSNVYLGVFIGDVSTTSSHDIEVTGCRLDSIGLNGIGSNNFGSHFKFRNNTYRRVGLIASASGTVNLGAGIEFRGGTDCIIENENMDSLNYGGLGGVDGIRLEYATEGVTGIVKDVVVKNCILKNFSAYGVRLMYNDNVRLIGNTIYGLSGGQQGIYVYSDVTQQKICKNILIQGNTLKNFPTYSAITLEGTGVYHTQYVKVADNIIDSVTNGVSLFLSDNNEFINNTVTHSTGAAFLQVTGNSNSYLYNKVTGSLSGLTIFAGDRPLIVNNNFHHNTQGLFIDTAVTNPSILTNDIHDNTSFQIAKNNSTGGGIYVDPSNNGEVRLTGNLLAEGRNSIGNTSNRWDHAYIDTVHSIYFAEDILAVISSSQNIGSPGNRWQFYGGFGDFTAGVTTDGATGLNNGYKVNRAGWNFTSRWGSTGTHGNEVYLSQNYDFYNDKRDDSTLVGISLMQDPLYGKTKFLKDKKVIAAIDSTGKLQLANVPLNTSGSTKVVVYKDADSSFEYTVLPTQITAPYQLEGSTPTFSKLESTNAYWDLGANSTLSLSNVNAGDKITIRIKQDGTGGHTLTLPANSHVAEGATINTAANSVSILKLDYYDGTDLYWSILKNY